jgi:hypothetical protein
MRCIGGGLSYEPSRKATASPSSYPGVSRKRKWRMPERSSSTFTRETMMTMDLPSGAIAELETATIF